MHRSQPVNSRQWPVPQHFAEPASGDENPLIDLAPARDESTDLHTPDHGFERPVSKLAERNSNFASPPVTIESSGAMPDGVPVPINRAKLHDVAGPNSVPLHAGRAQLEAIRALMIAMC